MASRWVSGKVRWSADSRWPRQHDQRAAEDKFVSHSLRSSAFAPAQRVWMYGWMDGRIGRIGRMDGSDGRMDGRVNRWMDGWMDGWMDAWTDRTDGWMDGWTDGQICGHMDGQMDGWMGGWTDGRMDRWRGQNPCAPGKLRGDGCRGRRAKQTVLPGDSDCQICKNGEKVPPRFRQNAWAAGHAPAHAETSARKEGTLPGTFSD